MPRRDEAVEVGQAEFRSNSRHERFRAEARAIVEEPGEDRRAHAQRKAEAKWRADQNERQSQMGRDFQQPSPNGAQAPEPPLAAAACADVMGAMSQPPEQAGQSARRALLTVCVLGVILIGSIGIWLADAYRAPVPSETTRVRPSPTAVQVSATPAQPASSVPLLLPERAREFQQKDSSKECNNCSEMVVVPVRSSAKAAPLLSPERERALQPKDIFKECDNCPEMVVVPAGTFTMGSPDSEQGHNPDESPQHSVTFALQFAVGRFAVTFDEWDACVAEGGCNGYKPSDQGWGRERRPVTNVSWYDAKAFVEWLSMKTGKAYRLLSEAEREYVTRAGTTSPFWWGSSISTGQANYDGEFTNRDGNGEYRGKTVPVDSFQPNPRGLYQVHGNLYDWVEDCYHDSYRKAPSDGSAWTSEDCHLRIVRGGSWIDDPRSLRSAYRLKLATVFRFRNLGFRVGRALTP